MPIFRIALLATVLACTGCTWVKPVPEAESIRIAGPAEVEACTRVGSTRASVRDRVASVQRSPGKVAEEIERLARASALEMGADTLVPAGPVRDGAREFIVYQCKGR